MGKAKQTNKKLEQEQSRLQKLDIKQVLEDYSLAELKFEACENRLLGNFDKDKNYKILDIIYPELINIQKVLGKRTSGFYTASCYVEQTTLNFVVKIERLEEGKISATLMLQEKLVFAKNFETTISTPLKTITDFDTPDFAFKVRSAFHLVNENDVDEISLLENYVSPPIELVTELIKKAEMYEFLKPAREKFETDYLSNILKILKKTEAGTLLVKNFFAIVKQNGLHEEKENRNQRFKELLDYLVDEKIAENALPQETVEEIAEARNSFVVDSKKEAYSLMQTKNKSGFKGFLGVKKNLSKDLVSPAPPSKAPEKEKAAPSFSPSSSSSSETGKKEEKKPSKDSKYSPIFAPLGEKPKSKIHKPFWAEVHSQAYQPPRETPPPPPLPPQPEPTPEQTTDFSLNASILGRARQEDNQTTGGVLVVEQSITIETQYIASIQIGVEKNYGVSVGVRMTATQTQAYEVDLSR